MDREILSCTSYHARAQTRKKKYCPCTRRTTLTMPVGNAATALQTVSRQAKPIGGVAGAGGV